MTDQIGQGTVTIDYNELRGLTALVKLAKGDPRYYLFGLCFDLDCGAAVTTNGHVLAWRGDLESEGCGQFIVPFESLKTITTGGKANQTVEIACNREGRVRLARSDGLLVECKPIDGTFPDYHRVIPETVSGEPAVYNLALIAELNRALNIMVPMKYTPVLNQNGLGAGVITTTKPDIAAVIMPMRSDSGEWQIPQPRSKPAAVAA